MNQQLPPMTKYDLQKLIYRIFKLNRSHLRFMRTFAEFSKSIGKEKELAQAYYDSIREEKESLLLLLEKQLKYLYELNAPAMIIASKQQELDSLKEIVGTLDVKGSSMLFEQELKNLNEWLAEDITDLTTNFCADSDYPVNLLFDDDEDGGQWKHDLLKT